MADLGINANNPEPIQNGNNPGVNKGKTKISWSNSIYTLTENGDGKVGRNDLQNEQNRHKHISKNAMEIFRLIDKFFNENSGKEWTNDLTNKLNRLLQAFNIKNKTEDCKTEEYFNEQGQMTGYTHYDSEGNVRSTGEFTYDSNGAPLLFSSKDANGNITYESYYEKRPDGQFEEINITQYD